MNILVLMLKIKTCTLYSSTLLLANDIKILKADSCESIIEEIGRNCKLKAMEHIFLIFNVCICVCSLTFYYTGKLEKIFQINNI